MAVMPGSGKYSNNGVLEDCSSGTYGKGSAARTACTPCIAGTYSEVIGMDSCGRCAAGTYSTEVGATSAASCKECGAGTYSGAGAGSCGRCAAGTYSAGVGAGSCSQCGMGTYIKKRGATSCKVCNRGKVVNAAKTSCDFPAKGYYSNDQREATLCPAGTYAEEDDVKREIEYEVILLNLLKRNISGCKKCSAGTFSATTGATQASTCQTCDSGEYQNLIGQASCKVCPGGNSKVNVAKTTCDFTGHPAYLKIAEGIFKLRPGFYMNSRGNPKECESGKVVNTAKTSCDFPPAGYYAFWEGEAVPCHKGTYATTSNELRWGPSSCTKCSAGTFSATTGATQASTCQICPDEDDKYQDLDGQSSCKSCAPGKMVTRLGTYKTGCGFPPVGYYSNDQRKAVPCPPGLYASASNVARTSCDSCPSGQYSTSATSNACGDPEWGHWSDNGVKTKCLPGTFMNKPQGPRANGCLRCKDLPDPVKGKYVRIGGSRCEVAEKGYWSNNGIKTPCPAGTFASKGAKRNNARGGGGCKKCSKGTYSSPGAQSCTLAEPGHWSNHGIKTECLAGSYAASAGARYSFIGKGGCKKCDGAGTYSSPGAQSCTLAEPGYWSDDGIRELCPAGHYADGRAQRDKAIHSYVGS